LSCLVNLIDIVNWLNSNWYQLMKMNIVLSWHL